MATRYFVMVGGQSVGSDNGFEALEDAAREARRHGLTSVEKVTAWGYANERSTSVPIDGAGDRAARIPDAPRRRK